MALRGGHDVAAAVRRLPSSTPEAFACAGPADANQFLPSAAARGGRQRGDEQSS